ncbi:unnamed protein product [Amaranthus hypochondriacus]
MVELVKTTCVILWFGIILLAWIWVMDEPRYLGTPPQRKTTFNHNFLKTFAKIRTTLVTLIIGAFLWLLKDIMLLKAKASFQMDRFKERVWESILHQEVLNTITEKLPRHDNGNCINNSRCGKLNMPRVLEDNISKENVSSWWINNAIKWFNDNQHLSYHDAKRTKYIKNPKDVEEAATDIHKAKQLFVMKPENMQWVEEKVEKVVEAKDLRPTKELMSALVYPDNANEEDHERPSVADALEKIYRHRDTIFKALQANKSLFETLNRLIDVLLLIVIITLWLILLNLLSIEVLGLVGGAIAGSAFLIGETAKNILTSLLFIFSVHPFDIGDWCLIEDTLVEIKDIRVLFTSTRTFNGEERYYSNTALVSQNITNYTRSHDMNDHLVFYPNINKAEDIVNAIVGFLRNNGYTKYLFVKEFLQDLEKLKIVLHYTNNSHEIDERTKRKSDLISKINDIILGKTDNDETKDIPIK